MEEEDIGNCLKSYKVPFSSIDALYAAPQILSSWSTSLNSCVLAMLFNPDSVNSGK